MAEEGKLRCKKFPSVRSHEVEISRKFEESFELGMKKNPSFNESGQTGYGLRENPKKTWRAADERRPLPPEKVCKQCGKGFQSMKALCGHMACHSDKERASAARDDLDHSWTSENQKMVLDSQSDSESEETRLRTRPFKSRRCKKISDDGSSVLSELDGQEQEEVAKCLMMLSRDSGSKGCLNSVVESSDNNSIVVETKSSSTEMRMEREKLPLDDGENAKMEDSDSGYFLDECGKGESDASVGWFRKQGSGSGSGSYQESFSESARMVRDEGGGMCRNPQKKSRYECFNCKKVFKSYQALGGHRPCSKRVCESRDESGENSPDDAAYYTKFVESSSKRKASGKNPPHLAERKSKNKKNKAHVCPFCNRVFKNGQAFGGHKRSHFLAGHDEGNRHGDQVGKPDLLDLNLPAPEAAEDEGGGGRLFSS